MVSKIREERQKGQLMCVLIPKDSKLPAKSAAKKFKTIKDDQEYFKIKIFSGEEKYAKDNKYIGEFILDNLPKGKAKSVTFEMFLEVNNEGIITINAEVESTGAKVSKSFSMISQEKTDTQEENKNQNEYVYLKSNPIYNKELSLIKGYVKNINEKNEALKTAENDEDKISYLNELCNSCLEIINIYENIKNDNNSENLNEKIFNYTKLLFSYYSQIIIIDKEEKYTENVINKIKELMPKYKMIILKTY
jgi:molecular chaperone DnaK (HSP70)